MSLTPREVTSGTTDTPTSSDSDKIVRISSTTGDMVVTLDTEANQSWNNEIFYVERATVNTGSISPASGVTMFLPDGSTITNGTVLTIPFQNGVIYLKHQGTGTDDWTVGGDIGSILGVPAVETGTTLTVGSEHIDALVRCSNTSAITVTFAVDADIPIGASGEIVQWGNGALSLTGSSVVLVSLDGDLTLSGLYASIVWTKLDATTYLIRGALAVETDPGLMIPDLVAINRGIGLSSRYYLPSGWTHAAAIPSEAVLSFMALPIAHDIDDPVLACEVTTGGDTGAVVRMGLYATAADGTIGDLIVDAGTVDATTTGVKGITASGITVQRGLVWCAAVVQGAAATRPTLAVSSHTSSMFGTILATLAPGTNSRFYPMQTSVAGALPATAAPDTSQRYAIGVALA